MAGVFFICHTQNRNVDMTRLNEVLSQAQYKQIGGDNMSVVYDHWVLTLVFICAWGFWYSVGKASGK